MRLFRTPLRKFGRPGCLPAQFGSGGDFPNVLANDLPSLTSRAACEVLWAPHSVFASGTMTIADDGRLRVTGAVAGTHSINYRHMVMPLTGTPQVNNYQIQLVVQSAVADTEAPVMQGTIAVTSITSESYITGVNTATDNVGVTEYQVSQDAGATWISRGLERTYDHTGRLPGSTDNVRWRARDAAGNWATPLATTVNLLPPPTDLTPPVMQGSITVTSLTSSSYTTSIAPATDNVGVTGYAVSHDGGITWIDKGTTRTHNHTGRQPESTDTVMWRARDAIGNLATPLVVSVELLPVPGVTAPTMNGSLLVSGLTSTAYTVSWMPASDAIGVLGYERSANGGITWENIGNVLATVFSGRMPGTIDAVRVRAFNGAGLRSGELSASVTLITLGDEPETSSSDDDQYVKAITEPIIRRALEIQQILIASSLRIDPNTGAVLGLGGSLPVTANVTIAPSNAATFNGKCLQFEAAHTITLSPGLPANFSFTALPPASGNASIAFTGGASGNGGATTTINRSAANLMFAVIKDERSTDRYVVTGS